MVLDGENGIESNIAQIKYQNYLHAYCLMCCNPSHIISEFIEDITYSSRYDNCELTVVFFCLSGISIRHRGLAAWLLGYLACLFAFVLNDKGDCNKGEAPPKLLECRMHPSTKSCFLGEGTSYCLLILTKSR